MEVIGDFEKSKYSRVEGTKFYWGVLGEWK